MVQALESAPRRAAGRVPPHNLEAEESLLGAMLLSRDAISAATEVRVEASDFYKPAHSHIYEAVMSLYGQGEPVDPVTVADELRRADLLDALGGRQTLMRLQAQTPASANAAHYAKIVNELALLRRLIAVAGDIAEMGYDDSGEVAETLDRAESLVFEVAEHRVSDSMVGVSDALQSTLDQLETLYGSQGEITGVQTGYTDLDSLLLGLQPSNLLVLAARPGAGKCVAWDTPIVDPHTGSVRTVAEVHRRGILGDEVQVLALGEDWRLRPSAASAFVDDGIKPVYRVRTRMGREVRTTSTHPFLTPRGWLALSELAVGTRVAVPREIPVFGNEALPEAEVSLMGLLIGDGSLRNSSPRMTAASAEVLAEVKRCGRELGVMTKHLGRYDYSLVTARGRPNPVIDLCRRHALWGKLARDKRVPDAVYRVPRQQIALFLNRLYATDGSVVVRPGGTTRIEYCSVSEGLARDVQHLLLRFGIVARLRARQVAYRGTRRPAWNLEISNAESIQRFCSEIGALGKEAAIAKTRAFALSRVANPNLDTLPVEVWSRILAAKGQRSWRSVSEAAGKPVNHNWHVGARSPQRGTVGLLADVLESDELGDLATSDVFWDEIVEIDFDGEHQVYDLTVPGLHNFVAGDVLVHNTAFALGAAANVAMSANRPVMFFSMEMGTLELTKRLLSGEARVEMRRLQTGNIPEGDWTKLSHAVGRLAEAPLFIDDNPHCTVMEMRAKARRAKARYGDLGLIVIDYLQLMTPSTSKKTENRQVEVAEISRGLKILARELDCPVMALAQLNRQLEYRQDKRPMLADLRESGCLTADTRVTRADTNEEVTMGELLLTGERDIPVWTLDEHLKLVPGTMTNVFPSGVKEVFELRLASGRRVKASANHPFLTLDGWQRLDELSPGSRIAAPRRIPQPERNTEWHDDELILLGHMLGDGCHLPRHALQYTTTDPDNAAAVAAAARSRFGIEARVQAERTWTQVYLPAPFHLTHGRRNPLGEWLDGLGVWGKRSYEKFVPREVFSLPERQIALFLRHLWATDGSVSVQETGQVHTYYATSSRALADGVQDLLLRLDIRARLRTVHHRKGRVGYMVDISGSTDQLRFAESVGVHGARGRLLDSALPALRSRKCNPNVDTVPREIWDYVRAKVMPNVGVTARELATRLGMQYCGSTLYEHSVSRARMQRLAGALPDPLLEDLAESDVLWDRVESITPSGAQPVFDATVLESHNFLANGIVVENSLEQDADVVIFLYRDEIYNPESEQRGTAEVIVSKHRNGPTGVTRLAFLDHYAKFANMARE